MLTSGRFGINPSAGGFNISSRVGQRQRGSILASAHGYHGDTGRDAFLSTRGQNYLVSMRGQGTLFSVRRNAPATFIGSTIPDDMMRELTSTSPGLCLGCSCCMTSEMDSLTESLQDDQASRANSPRISGGEMTEKLTNLDLASSAGLAVEVSEWKLVGQLAMPLMFGKVADEISTVSSMAFYGHLGTAALAASTIAYSGMNFTLVFVYGLQQAAYTLVPQASGSGNTKQVGTVLSMMMLWTCVFIMIPIIISWFFLGDVLQLIGAGDSSGTVENSCVATNLTLNTTSGGGYGDGGGGGSTGIDIGRVTSYARASLTWLFPYTAVMSITTWLECLEIVTTVSFVNAASTLFKVFTTYVFMFPMNYGLNGYAYGYALSSLIQCFLMWFVVFKWKKQHMNPVQYWHGFDLKAALNKKQTCRYIKMSTPMIVQLAMQSWASTFFYAFMASYGAEQVSGYGVADQMTGTGGSIALALYTATSVRVGTVLGENAPERAKTAALAGVCYSIVAGGVLASCMFLARGKLAMLFSPTDEYVQTLIKNSSVPVAIFYFLNSVVYGLWAVLEAQMRPGIPSFGLVVSQWFVSVPLTVILLKFACITNLPQFAGLSPLEVCWWSQNVGQIMMLTLLGGSILCSDWEALAQEAVEYAASCEEEAEDEDDPGSGEEFNFEMKRDRKKSRRLTGIEDAAAPPDALRGSTSIFDGLPPDTDA